MRALKGFILAVFGLLIVGSAVAQPGGNLGQIELKVTEKFRAEVGESRKISDKPDFRDTTTSKLKVNYRISSRPIEVKFSPDPISPARIARVPVDDLNQGLVRLGFGLYVTPLAEAYWNSDRSSQKSYGLWGRHFSTIEGADRIFTTNNLSESELGAYYNRFYRKMTWSSKVSAAWNRYSYYGIDEFPNLDNQNVNDFKADPQKPLTNTYSQFELVSGVSARDAKDLGMLDEARLEYYYMGDSYNADENRLQLFSTWQLPTGEKPLNLELNLSALGTSFDSTTLGAESSYLRHQFDSIYSTSQTHLTVQARPSIDLVLNNLFFRFGVNLYANNYDASLTGGEFNLFFFPEVQIYFPFVEDVLSIYGGVEGQIRQNSFRNLVAENPYVNPAFISRPSRNTDIFLGFEGLLSATTSFNLRGGVLLQKDLGIYYRDPAYRSNYFIDSLRSFPALDLLYDNSQTFYARGELSVNLDNNLQAGLFGELRAYDMANLEEAWHLPSFLAGMNFTYTYRGKLKLGTDWNYVGKRTAFLQEDMPSISAELPGYLDVGLNFEYLYNSRLSGFVNVTNLLNQKYDLYLGYKAQRIGFLMGFAYKL